MKNFKKINILIFILSFFIIGCSIDSTDENGSIDNEVRAKIKVQTDKLIEAIIKNDSTKLYDLLSDYYEQAKKDYAKNNLINTIMDIDLVRQTVNPANQYFTYQEDSVMKAFSNKIFTEANLKYPLPITISEILTTPQIIDVSPQIIDEGVFPVVKYKTELNLKDTIALKKENIELQKIISNIFPKIINDKKYIFFQAYNEIPNGNKKTDSYGFVMMPN